MARVRVGDEDVHALFRPGGSVEDIDRTDRSGRTRFNLETGLQFANQAMRSPALGVGANLLGRGLTALGRSIRQDGTTDMAALRQQAAARLAGAAPDMAAGRMAIGDARAEQAGRDAQAQQILGQPADPLDSVRFGQSLSGQQRPLSLGDVNSSGLATQNPYALGSSPNMQYLPEGAAPFSTGLEQAARAEQERGQPERPPLPQIDYDRPFFSEDDMNRHKELRKHLTTASSPAEAIRIAHEMHAHQDRMAGRPNMVGEARNAASNWAQQYVQNRGAVPAGMDSAAAAPAAPEPQIVMAQTPAGEVPVVKLDDRTLAMRDPETNGMLHVEMVNGRPVVKQRFSAEEMMQLAQQQQAPAPAAAAPLSQMASRERAAEMLRSGLGRQKQEPLAPQAPALDEFGRTPEKAAEDKRRAAELVHAPMAQRGPMDRDQLLAAAAMARTPQEQADILRRVPDVDVWGTTLEDILTGSHQAKGQFLRQLHEVMPQQHLAPLKSPQELALISAQTAKEKALEKMYSSKPGESDRRLTVAEKRAADAMDHAMRQERAAEHRIAATEAATTARERIAARANDTRLGKLALDLQKLKDMEGNVGAFKKHGLVNVNIGSDAGKMAKLIEDAVNNRKKEIHDELEKPKQIVRDHKRFLQMDTSTFDSEFPGKAPGQRPADYVPSDDAGDYSADTLEKHMKSVKDEQDKWDKEDKEAKKARRDALNTLSTVKAAAQEVDDPATQAQLTYADQLAVDAGETLKNIGKKIKEVTTPKAAAPKGK